MFLIDRQIDRKCIRKSFSILKICIYFAVLNTDFFRGVKWGFLYFGKVIKIINEFLEVP